MSENKKFVIRCRAVIFHEGKLMVVKHKHDDDYTALPGGHLEFGEDVKECLRREIIEELGVEPKIGRLLYINTFVSGETQPVEFFFEVKNGKDFLDIKKIDCSHGHELAEIYWISPNEDTNLLPPKFAKDFKEGKVRVNAEGREGALGQLSDEVRYIKDGE